MRTPPEPFALGEGRLELDGLELEALIPSLEGQAAWLLSRAALSEAAARAAGSPACVDVGAIGPAAVLSQFARAGWWARAHSGHELAVAAEAGFPPERLVAAGAVKDDGFLKDALVLGVAVLETGDEPERANVARIAAGLGRPVPAGTGAPLPIAPGNLSGLGGLLARVLRPAPALGLDAAWEAAWAPTPAEVWPLRPGEDLQEGTLEGLSRTDAPTPGPARIHGAPARGDWVVVPGPGAVLLRRPDPTHGEASTLLVGDGSWRQLPSRPWPPISG